MAKVVFLDCFFSYKGTDRSDQVSKAEVMSERSELDASVFGDRAKEYEKGVFDNGLTIHLKPDADFVFQKEVLTDYAADVPIAVVIRPDAAANATDNPEWRGNAVISKPIPGSFNMGELYEGDVTWKITGPWVVDFDSGGEITLG